MWIIVSTCSAFSVESTSHWWACCHLYSNLVRQVNATILPIFQIGGWGGWLKLRASSLPNHSRGESLQGSFMPQVNASFATGAHPYPKPPGIAYVLDKSWKTFCPSTCLRCVSFPVTVMWWVREWDMNQDVYSSDFASALNSWRRQNLLSLSLHPPICNKGLIVLTYLKVDNKIM